MLSTTHRISGLDELRGIAILLVVIFHYVTRSIDPTVSVIAKYLFHLTYYFNSGVDLFFVLSGFLITKRLLLTKGTPGFLKHFFQNRIRRILPLYYFVLTLSCIAISLGMGDHTSWSLSADVPLYSYFIFLQNEWMAVNNTMGCRLLAIYWSLGIEIQFYLIIGILFCFFRPRKIMWVLILLALTALLLRHYDGTQIGRYTHFYCRMDSVFIGAIIALVFQKEYLLNLLHHHKKKLELIFLIQLFISAALTFRLVRIPETYIPTHFALLFSTAVLLQLARTNNPPANMFSRVLIFLGKYSFGIYILHELVRAILFFSFMSYEPKLHSLNDLVLTVLSIAITLALSVVSFNSIERIYSRGSKNINAAIAMDCQQKKGPKPL